MKQIFIKKRYIHTAHRTWSVGDTPTVSDSLARKLIQDGIADEIGDRDVLDTRGVTQDEFDDAIEDAKRQEQEYKKEKKPKKEKAN